MGYLIYMLYIVLFRIYFPKLSKDICQQIGFNEGLNVNYKFLINWKENNWYNNLGFGLDTLIKALVS